LQPDATFYISRYISKSIHHYPVHLLANRNAWFIYLDPSSYVGPSLSNFLDMAPGKPNATTDRFCIRGGHVKGIGDEEGSELLQFREEDKAGLQQDANGDGI